MAIAQSIPPAPGRDSPHSRHRWFLDHFGMEEEYVAIAIERTWSARRWVGEDIRQHEPGLPIVLVWTEIRSTPDRTRPFLPINLGPRYDECFQFWGQANRAGMAAAAQAGFADIVEMSAPNLLSRSSRRTERNGLVLVRETEHALALPPAELLDYLSGRLLWLPPRKGRRLRRGLPRGSAGT